MLLKDVDESPDEKVVGVSNGSLETFGEDGDEGGADEVVGGGAVAPVGTPAGKSPPCVGGAVGSYRCCSAIIWSGDGGANIFPNMIPIPSMSANKTPPTAAALAAAWGPARSASVPPVAAPLMIEFQGSSFCRMAVREQSKQAKIPPHMANCPPKTGARACTAERDPANRAPEGAIRAPLIECHNPPPMFPMQKAPPTSSIILHGQGSLSAIPDWRVIVIVYS